MAVIWLILSDITGYLIFNHYFKFLYLHGNINGKNAFLISLEVSNRETFFTSVIKFI